MGMLLEMTLKTEKEGVQLPPKYFRIPRKGKDGFHAHQAGDKHINFPVEVWGDYETRLEVDNGKVPLRTIQVRLVDGTPEQVYGKPAVEAVYSEPDEYGRRELISEGEPPILGMRQTMPEDYYTARYEDVVDVIELRRQVAINTLEIISEYDEFIETQEYAEMSEEEQLEYRADIEKRLMDVEPICIVGMFYNYLMGKEGYEGETDFAGLDMTRAVDHP